MKDLYAAIWRGFKSRDDLLRVWVKHMRARSTDVRTLRRYVDYPFTAPEAMPDTIFLLKIKNKISIGTVIRRMSAKSRLLALA